MRQESLVIGKSRKIAAAKYRMMHCVDIPFLERIGFLASCWLAQAAHDLEHAEHSLEGGHYDWACFAAHQAAEKAVKGLYLHLGGEPIR